MGREQAWAWAIQYRHEDDPEDEWEDEEVVTTEPEARRAVSGNIPPSVTVRAVPLVPLVALAYRSDR